MEHTFVHRYLQWMMEKRWHAYTTSSTTHVYLESGVLLQGEDYVYRSYLSSRTSHLRSPRMVLGDDEKIARVGHVMGVSKAYANRVEYEP